jgi:uncharacterized repeat protein (TIGR04076 family)
MSRIKVTVERIDGYCNLPMQVGDHFFVEDSKLTVPEGRHLCIWALQTVLPMLPLLAVKDSLPSSHWAGKVRTISCPDPKGQVQYRLELLEPSSSSTAGRRDVPG